MLSQAISLVLHHPPSAHAVDDPDALSALDKPGISVLQTLILQARESKQASTATLLERWRDQPEYERLAELAEGAALVPDVEAAGRELRMAVQKLIETFGAGHRTNELLRKAEELGLNSDEKAELSLLLKSRNQPPAKS
jgi:DNA primase